jgi:hypothetical protein
MTVSGLAAPAGYALLDAASPRRNCARTVSKASRGLHIKSGASDVEISAAMLGFLSLGQRSPGTGLAVSAPSRGRSVAGRLGSALAFLLVVAPAAAFAVSGPGKEEGRPAASARPPTGQPLAGTWRHLPAAPIAIDDGPLASV